MSQVEDKKQIVIVHGGDSFGSYQEYIEDLKSTQLDIERLKPSRRWKDSVIDAFPDADVLLPTMPNSANAQFEEWKIYFEKLLPFLGDNTSLIGHSLGAMFLAKYLHENKLAKPVRQLILLAGGYDDPTTNYGSFKLESATGLEDSALAIDLLHSRDDFVVNFSELAKFEADLPDATVHSFDDKNHFLDEDFPELIEILKQT